MDSETRISRRKMLRNVGIAGAVAWTAPVLTSLGTPAFAATTNKQNKKCAINAAASGGAGCEVCPSGGFTAICGANSDCLCFVTTKGCCFCDQPSSCSGLQSCSKDSDCPPGFQCTHSCCDASFGPLCGPPCGDRRFVLKAGQHGMTQAGRR